MNSDAHDLNFFQIFRSRNRGEIVECKTENHHFSSSKRNSQDRRLKFGVTWFLIKGYNLVGKKSESV